MHNLGHTRSANRRDHLFLTPDTFIRTPLPGLTKGEAIVHIASPTGAAFTMMTLEIAPKGTLIQGPTQRLLYVLEGELKLEEPGKHIPHDLAPGSYAYFPMGYPHTLTATTPSRVVVIDKPFLPLDPLYINDRGADPLPWFLLGTEQDIAPEPLSNGQGLDDPGIQVRHLLPDSHIFDFACNTMTYDPGAALSQVEVHYMEHGLLMLQGGGIYRLDDDWYPTHSGDVIWMSAFCPQWFAAIGKQPAKYLIYKDFNRHPLG
ncbi:MAG: (S)-ureidoglycine aminohydrolase [Acidobacteriaceae bacterium]